MKKIIYLALVVLMFSCEDTNFEFESNNGALRIINQDSKFKDMKDYSHFLSTEATINAFFDTGIYSETPKTQAMLYSGEENITYLINNQKVEVQDNGYLSKSYIDGLLGTNVLFTVLKDNKSLFNETLYLPIPLELQSISADRVEEYESKVYELSIEESLSIQLNSDDQNNNGLMVFANWDGKTGEVTLDKIEENTSEGKTLILYTEEDKGELNIPSNILNEFPKGAHVSFLVNRGNFEEINERFFFGSRSELLINTILK